MFPDVMFPGWDEPWEWVVMPSTKTYKIIRFCADEGDPAHKSIVKTGLTLEEAQAHCNNPNTHYMDPETKRVVWFDGYDEER